MQNPLQMKIVWILCAVGNIYYMWKAPSSLARTLHFASAVLSVLYLLELMYKTH